MPSWLTGHVVKSMLWNSELFKSQLRFGNSYLSFSQDSSYTSKHDICKDTPTISCVLNTNKKHLETFNTDLILCYLNSFRLLSPLISYALR